MTMITKRPVCGSELGYYEKLVQSYAQHYTFNGEPFTAGDATHIQGGKRKYCSECDTDITKYINN